MPTRRRSALPLLALALSLFATLAAAGEPKPARIVSTTPSVTGILLAMDAPLVASAATTPSRLTDAKGFFSQWAKVADQRGVEVLYRNLRFDIEAVIAQDPDLLVASATGADSAAPYRAELEAQGVPTLVVDYSKHSWQELATELGRHTGLERQAQAAIQRFDAYTAEVAAPSRRRRARSAWSATTSPAAIPSAARPAPRHACSRPSASRWRNCRRRWRAR